VLDKTRLYLTDTLLPFWINRSPDPKFGGFLTYFDRDGKPTARQTSLFSLQIRMLFAMSAAHRAACGNGRCGVLAAEAADFIIRHYWDQEFEGWYWTADRKGNPVHRDKVGYGHCFGI